MSDIDWEVGNICVGTATSKAEELAALCKLPLPDIPPGLFGRVMSGFSHNLMGIGNFCEKDCKVTFTKHMVIIYNNIGKPFLTGWQESGGAKMWRILLKPDLVSPLPPPW